MDKANIERVGARIVWLIGARSDAYAFETDDDRFDKYEIAQAIIETETELARDLAESYHPQRKPFLKWKPDDGLKSGDIIPRHTGQIEAVRIAPTEDDAAAMDGDEEISDRCATILIAEPTTATNIGLWRADKKLAPKDRVFDPIAHDEEGSSLAGKYNLTNQTLEFTGERAQVHVFSYEPIYPDKAEGKLGTLQIDAMFEGVLVAGTIPKLLKIGIEPGLVSQYAEQYATARQTIRVGLNSKMEVAEAQRAD